MYRGLSSLAFPVAIIVLTTLAHPVTVSSRPAGTSVSPQIQDYVSNNLQDLSIAVEKTGYDQSAGKKVSDEFGLLYKLAGNGTLRYKQPNQFRINGKIAGLPGAFIMDGAVQRVRVGSIHKNMDQSQAPGRITTLLDLGLLSDFYLSYADPHFVGEQTVNGASCAVFRLTYPDRLHYKSSRVVWIDPRTKIIVRREEVKQGGSERAVFIYNTPVEVAKGVWIPTHIEADNADGQKVGSLLFEDIHANQGLSDNLFK